MQPPGPLTIKVSKIDAARRQLDCAIQLWFKDGDEVSIHTLALAAYEIIQDLNNKAGNQDTTLLGMAKKFAPPEHLQEVIHQLRKPMTFFKHADRDPHGIIEFTVKSNEAHMMLACHGLEMLGEQRSDLRKAFNIWLLINDPELFPDAQQTLSELFRADALREFKRVNKREFLEKILHVIAISRAR